MARSYAAEMHSGFPDVRDQLGMEFARRLPMPELRATTKEQIARILAAWGEALSQYGSQGGFLFGDFSIADCMYAPVVSRFTTYGVEVPADVRAYMDRVWALPAMAEWRRGAEEEVAAGLGSYND
jgi:glutathione S-transferase